MPGYIRGERKNFSKNRSSGLLGYIQGERKKFSKKPEF